MGFARTNVSLRSERGFRPQLQAVLCAGHVAARSHRYRHLAVFAKVRSLAGDPRLGEFEHGNSGARRSVPQLRGNRAHPQHADIGIVRAVPPDVIGALPDFCCLRMVTLDLGPRCERQVGPLFWVDEYETHLVLGLDLMLFAAAQIGDKPDDTGVPVGSCFEGPRPQTTSEFGGQHADAYLLDDPPDALYAMLAHFRVNPDR